MNQWQPIETAPKDGTHIWLGAPATANDPHGFVRVAYWANGYGFWVDMACAENGAEDSVHFEPTHWMSLPKPPAP